MKDVIIFGASSYYELSELIQDINASCSKSDRIRVIGLLDDNKSLHGSKILGVEVLGDLLRYKNFPNVDGYVFGIGSHKTHLERRYILERLAIPDEKWISLIHPTAKVFSTASIGQGVIIHFGTIIFNGSKVGDFSIIMALSVIGANNVIGKGCLITSAVSSTNNVKIGNYSFIGTNTGISEGVEIGPGSKVAMCSHVRKSTKPGQFVFNNPAKTIMGVEVDQEIITEWHSFLNDI